MPGSWKDFDEENPAIGPPEKPKKSGWYPDCYDPRYVKKLEASNAALRQRLARLVEAAEAIVKDFDFNSSILTNLAKIPMGSFSNLVKAIAAAKEV
jgi:hypothetical protein